MIFRNSHANAVNKQLVADYEKKISELKDEMIKIQKQKSDVSHSPFVFVDDFILYM